MADSKSGRKKVALLLVGMVLGAALITPAGAHVTSVRHSWKKHFLPLAKKVFYTKTQSDSRYLGKTATANNSELLDNKDSTEFLGATAKATDAELLDGLDSAAFIRNATRRSSDLVAVSGNGTAFATASCEAGEKAVGGGGTTGGDPSLVIAQSAPTPAFTSPGTPNGWVVMYKDLDGSGGSMRAFVVCIS